MNTDEPLEGPDPRSLDDDELFAASDRLTRLLDDLAAEVRHTADVKYVWAANRLAYELLNREARRRMNQLVEGDSTALDDAIRRLLGGEDSP